MSAVAGRYLHVLDATIKEQRETIARLERERDEALLNVAAMSDGPTIEEWQAWLAEAKAEVDAAHATAARMRRAIGVVLDRCLDITDADNVSYEGMLRAALTPDDGWLARHDAEVGQRILALGHNDDCLFCGFKDSFAYSLVEARALLGGTPTKEGE